MIKKVSILMMVLAIIPFTVTAAEVMSNPEMSNLIGQNGIDFDLLPSMSLQEIREAFDFEDIQALSDEERQEFRTVLREKFKALSDEEKAQLRQERQERMANMTPEERDALRQRIQERFGEGEMGGFGERSMENGAQFRHMSGRPCQFSR